MTKTELALVAALGGVACGGAAADHESLGDRAYVDRNYGDALVEFQLALRQQAPDGDLRRKAGMAALHARELAEAAIQFRALAAEDGDQAAVAADGLERVARAASGEGNRSALQAALQGLSEISSGRALGTFAREMAGELGDDPGSPEALTILPFAAAAAPDARLQDSLMFAYATALVRQRGCEAAVPIFESLLRRRREPSIVSDARARATTCALGVGLRQLNRGSPDRAEEWFNRAVQIGEGTYAARVAYLGLGNVRFARGDVVGACEAFRQAMVQGSPADSIYRQAQRGLDRLRGFAGFGRLGRAERCNPAGTRR